MMKVGNVMSITEVVTKGGKPPFPAPFTTKTYADGVIGGCQKKAEMNIMVSETTLISLCFSSHKTISAFFTKIIKLIIGCFWGKGGRKHAISVTCHYFRLFKWGI
jgi:hypothetical protein